MNIARDVYLSFLLMTVHCGFQTTCAKNLSIFFFFFFFLFIIISTLFKVIATGPCQHVLARPMGNYQGCKKKKRIIYKAISIKIININMSKTSKRKSTRKKNKVKKH